MKSAIVALVLVLIQTNFAFSAILIRTTNGKLVGRAPQTLESARTSPYCVGTIIEVTSKLTAAQSNISAPWPNDRMLSVRKGGIVCPTAHFVIDKRNLTVGNYRWIGGWISVTGTPAIPQWYGALGDGSGLTPTDTDEDISTASWNTWDNTPFKTNLSYSPFGTTGSFTPPTEKPFLNTDTWDYIGGNLALWAGAKATHFPIGSYVLALNSAGDGVRVFSGLLLMRGQEQIVTGDGKFQTYIGTKENAAFFAANNKGTQNRYKLLTLYRTGGAQTEIRGLQLSGPVSYAQDNYNLTLSWETNTNAVAMESLWLTQADMGRWMQDSSGDAYISRTTAEYLFSEVVHTDATSEVAIDFCNFWSSAATPYQKGINALGSTRVSNTRFWGFKAGAILADSGIVTGNTFQADGTITVSLLHDSVLTGNTFTGTTSYSMVALGYNSSVTGNYFKNTSPHPTLLLGTATTGSAIKLTISGNTFVKTDATSAADNYAIVAPAGSDYTTGADASALIGLNTFTGRAMTAIGSATFGTNSF